MYKKLLKLSTLVAVSLSFSTAMATTYCNNSQITITNNTDYDLTVSHIERIVISECSGSSRHISCSTKSNGKLLHLSEGNIIRAHSAAIAIAHLTSESNGNTYGHISLVNNKGKIRMAELYYKFEGSFFGSKCNAKSSVVDAYNFEHIDSTHTDGTPASIKFEIN